MCLGTETAAGASCGGGGGGSGDDCGGLYRVNDWLSPWVEPALAKDKTGGVRGHLEHKGSHLSHQRKPGV